jgi:proteic killer suppression protein
MDIRFEKTYLSELYYTGKSGNKKYRFQPQVLKGYVTCVKALQRASRIEDLFQYHSLHYEKLRGDKEGLSSVRINLQYRLEFRELTAPDGEVEITICSLVDISNHYK